MVYVCARGLEEVVVSGGAGHIPQGADPEIDVGARLGVDLVGEGHKLLNLVQFKTPEPVEGLSVWIAPAEFNLALSAEGKPECQGIVHGVCIRPEAIREC